MKEGKLKQKRMNVTNVTNKTKTLKENRFYFMIYKLTEKKNVKEVLYLRNFYYVNPRAEPHTNLVNLKK